MTDTLRSTIDYLWGGVGDDWCERAQRTDPRAQDVLRAVGAALAEINAGDSRCTACGTALQTDSDMHACAVARILKEPGLAIAMPFCQAGATSHERLSQLTKTHLAAALSADLGSGSATPADPQAIAQQLVLTDAYHAGEALRRHGRTGDAHTFADIIADKAAPVNDRMVQLVIGCRDDLSQAEARAAAAAWRNLRQTAPPSPIYVQLLGYDQDPRELWQFAEVRRHVRRWARAAGIPAGPEATVHELPDAQFPTLIGTLAACGWFGEAARQEALACFRAENGVVTSH